MPANHPFIHHAETAQTITGKFYNVSNTLVTTITGDESPGGSGRYIKTAAQLAAVPLAANDYDVRVEVNGNLVRSYLLRWDGTAEVGDALDAVGIRAAIGMAAADLDAQLSSLASLDAAAIRAAIGMAAADLDTQLDALLPGVDTRDLEPPQHVWKVPNRATGTVEAAELLRIQAGETIAAGFDLLGSPFLPQNAVIATVGNPTGLSGTLSATKKGTNGRFATLLVTAAAGAINGTEQVVKVSVTNSFGDGPILLAGRIRVVEPAA